MSKSSYDLSGLLKIPDAKTAIIQSKWHKDISDNMIQKCQEVLKVSGAAEPQVHVLPGTIELPIAALTLVKKYPELEAIIAFGVILKGDTFHFEMVMQQCFNGFNNVSLEHNIPVINEVLPVLSIDDAVKRSANDKFNKGYEAGIAALEIIAWRRQVLDNR